MYLHHSVHTSTNQYKPVHTGMYWYVLVCTSIYQYRQVQTSTDKYIPVWTGLYWYVLVHTSMYQYRQVHTSMYWLVQVCTSTYREFLDSKKLQTGLKPVIFCILFVYFTAALRVHSEQIPGIYHSKCWCIYKFSSIHGRVPGS